MSVNDVSNAKAKAAWLYNFAIDSAKLTQEHKNWLDLWVIKPLRDEHRTLQATGAGTSNPWSWLVWLIGNTSRTGSFQYNLALSDRRAAAVRDYILSAMGPSDVVFDIKIAGVSESRAQLLGVKDETEDMMHRAVFVCAGRQDLKIPPVPPEIKAPTQSVSVDFYFYAERGSWFNVMKWRGELYASFSTKGARKYIGWKCTSSGMSVNPGDINTAAPPIPSTDKIFAGPGQISLPDTDALKRLDKATIYPQVVGTTLKIRIVDAAPDRSDLHLKMKILKGNTELSQAVGSLGVSKPLDEAATRELQKAIQFVRTGGVIYA